MRAIRGDYLMTKRSTNIIIGLITSLYLYFLLWPVPIDPVAWTPQKLPKMIGVYEPNNRLAFVQRLKIDIGVAPHDVAIDAQGRVYTGLEDGSIVRFQTLGHKPEVFSNTGGRPMGLEFSQDGNLYVADANRGLLSISPDGLVQVLSIEAAGMPFKFTNAMDIATDGTIYFSDGSNKFSVDQLMLYLLEQKPEGRLLAYDPTTRKTKVLLENLYFANGVAVSPDQSFVLICETWRYRVRRYWLGGPLQGKSDIFIDNLPGFPESITSNRRGIFWVALVEGPQSRQYFDNLLPIPLLRKVILRLPAFLRPRPTPVGYVLGLDLDGRIVHNLQDPTGSFYAEITHAKENQGILYLGSRSEDALGLISLSLRD
jgi:sugar lactone lactonase YvrE